MQYTLQLISDSRQCNNSGNSVTFLLLVLLSGEVNLLCVDDGVWDKLFNKLCC